MDAAGRRGPARGGVSARSQPGSGLSRREFLRGMSAAGALAFLPALPPAHRRGQGAGPPPLFLDGDEIAVLEALAEHLLPAGELPGGRDLGVADYVQSLLTFGPGADANCDGLVSAADLPAAAQVVAGRGGCPEAGDVNGDGRRDPADLALMPAAAFRARPWFAGGPFSDRNPQPHLVPTGGRPCAACHGGGQSAAAHARGAAGTRGIVEDVRPPNAFVRHIPMTRLQRLSWQVRLNGRDAVPEVAANPLAAELLETDLRRRYREGLAEVVRLSRERFGREFPALSAGEREGVLAAVDPAFVRLLMLHVIEGTLCAPEYGGNRGRLGWRMTGFGGDSQPLGYTIWDPASGGYVERADRPNSTPDPGEDCRGFSAPMSAFLRALASLVAGEAGIFGEPYCFEVG